MVDYTKNVSLNLYDHHHHTIVQDDDDAECHKYLYEILDMSCMMIPNSPAEGVASG